MKRVAADPSLRDSWGIGHSFTNKMGRKLWIGGGGFLLCKEELKFRRMLESHGRGFAFSANKIGCVEPTIVEPMVIFMILHIPWNIKLILVPRATQGEDGNRNPRTFECAILELIVHRVEENPSFHFI